MRLRRKRIIGEGEERKGQGSMIEGPTLTKGERWQEMGEDGKNRIGQGGEDTDEEIEGDEEEEETMQRNNRRSGLLRPKEKEQAWYPTPPMSETSAERPTKRPRTDDGPTMMINSTLSDTELDTEAHRMLRFKSLTYQAPLSSLRATQNPEGTPDE